MCQAQQTMRYTL